MKLSQKILLGVMVTVIIVGSMLILFNLRGRNLREELEKTMTSNELAYRKYNSQYSEMETIRNYVKDYEMNIVGRLLGLHEYYPLYKPEGFENPEPLGEYIDSERLASALGVSYDDSVKFIESANTGEGREMGEDIAELVEYTAENAIANTIVTIDYTYNAEEKYLQQWISVSQPLRGWSYRIMLQYNDRGYAEVWVE